MDIFRYVYTVCVCDIFDTYREFRKMVRPALKKLTTKLEIYY